MLAWAGTNLENVSVAQIVISTAPHESQTLAYTYASLALNNSFFLHHLVSPRPRSPPPSITQLIIDVHNCMYAGEVETADKVIAEPRRGVVRQMGERRPDAKSRRRDRRADGFPARSQDVRGGRSVGHALLERFHLACHRHPRSSRRHRDLWRWHASRQRATTISLAGRQHRVWWCIRRRGNTCFPTNTNNTPGNVPCFRTHSPAHLHVPAHSPWCAPAVDEHVHTRSHGWCRAPSKLMVHHVIILRFRWHGRERT